MSRLYVYQKIEKLVRRHGTRDPFELLDAFRAGIDGALGEGACHVLSIRPQGGVEMEV